MGPREHTVSFFFCARKFFSTRAHLNLVHSTAVLSVVNLVRNTPTNTAVDLACTHSLLLVVVLNLVLTYWRFNMHQLMDDACTHACTHGAAADADELLMTIQHAWAA